MLMDGCIASSEGAVTMSAGTMSTEGQSGTSACCIVAIHFSYLRRAGHIGASPGKKGKKKKKKGQAKDGTVCTTMFLHSGMANMAHS